MSDKLLTTNQAAEQLNVTPIRIRAMIRDGRLKAEKMGRDYVIKESALEFVRNRKPGRPPKSTPNK